MNVFFMSLVQRGNVYSHSKSKPAVDHSFKLDESTTMSEGRLRSGFKRSHHAVMCSFSPIEINDELNIIMIFGVLGKVVIFGPTG